jgi:hypothetical protein
MSLSRYGGPTGSSIEGNVPDATADGTTYGRKNNAWVSVLPIVGGTLSGPLTLSGAPTSASMAATKQYIDDGLATKSSTAHNHDATYAALAHNHSGVYSPVGHAHSGADITSGTVAAAYLPTFGTAAAGIVGASGGGTTNFLRADGTWTTVSNLADGDKGDITISSGVWSVDAGAITLSKIANIATNRLLGRTTASSGVVEELTIGNGLTNDGTTIQVSALAQNSQSAAYTLVLSDAQKHILHPAADTTARTWTIPANSSVAYPIGTAITFVNQNAAGVITIAITTDTMRLAGAGTTGNRTLAANGVATALKITSTEWIISGTGLT